MWDVKMEMLVSVYWTSVVGVVEVEMEMKIK